MSQTNTHYRKVVSYVISLDGLLHQILYSLSELRWLVLFLIDEFSGSSRNQQSIDSVEQLIKFTLISVVRDWYNSNYIVSYFTLLLKPPRILHMRLLHRNILRMGTNATQRVMSIFLPQDLFVD